MVEEWKSKLNIYLSLEPVHTCKSFVTRLPDEQHVTVPGGLTQHLKRPGTPLRKSTPLTATGDNSPPPPTSAFSG